jgi:D-sedoheptulose 7-phosphate isomerase
MQIRGEYIEFLDEHNALFSQLHKIGLGVTKAANIIIKTIKAGNKILICGNGGSAADAQHLAAELVGRFEKERKALPAIAFTTDTSILTAVGNDYGYDAIFSRQVEGLGVTGDTLIGISTSGNSKNVIMAVEAGKNKGIKSIGLIGNDEGTLASMCDLAVIVPHSVTARIQEAHIFIIHFWVAYIEKELFASD